MMIYMSQNNLISDNHLTRINIILYIFLLCELSNHNHVICTINVYFIAFICYSVLLRLNIISLSYTKKNLSLIFICLMFCFMVLLNISDH